MVFKTLFVNRNGVKTSGILVWCSFGVWQCTEDVAKIPVVLQARLSRLRSVISPPAAEQPAAVHQPKPNVTSAVGIVVKLSRRWARAYTLSFLGPILFLQHEIIIFQHIRVYSNDRSLNYSNGNQISACLKQQFFLQFSFISVKNSSFESCLNLITSSIRRLFSNTQTQLRLKHISRCDLLTVFHEILSKFVI